jgi:hypothetical protein
MKLQGQLALCLGFVTFLEYLIFSHLEMYASPHSFFPPSLSLSLTISVFFGKGGEGGVVYIIHMTEELRIRKYKLLLYHLHILMLLPVV